MGRTRATGRVAAALLVLLGALGALPGPALTQELPVPTVSVPGVPLLPTAETIAPTVAAAVPTVAAPVPTAPIAVPPLPTPPALPDVPPVPAVPALPELVPAVPSVAVPEIALPAAGPISPLVPSVVPTLALTAGRTPAPTATPTMTPVPAGARTVAPAALVFEANQGQSPPGTDFLARVTGYSVTLSATEARFALVQAAPPPGPTLRSATPGGPSLTAPPTARAAPAVAELQLRFDGANPAAIAEPLAPRRGVVHYYRGADPSRWLTGVPTYGAVAYRALYPGIDLLYYGRGTQLEYDFVVAPGADPSAIALSAAGATAVALDPTGDLLLTTPAGTLRQARPVAYQEVGGQRRPVDAAYTLLGPSRFAFRLGSYDPRLPLVIDPLVSFEALSGMPGDDTGRAIGLDAAGHPYVAGVLYAGSGGLEDAYVAKLSLDGGEQLYLAILGGTGTSDDEDRAYAIAVDPDGTAYVAGGTRSSSFPVTAGTAVQPAAPAHPDFGVRDNAFLARLSPTGELVYGTYLGGDFDDVALGVASDGTGRAYVAGRTGADDFPTRHGLRNTTSGSIDGFVARINTTVAGSDGLEFSTYLGGRARPDGTPDAYDSATSISLARGLDGQPLPDVAYVAGLTEAQDFPLTPETALQTTQSGGTRGACEQYEDPYVGARCVAPDAFLVKLTTAPVGGDPTADRPAALLYGTLLGGAGDDVATAVVVDASGRAYVAGLTWSSAMTFEPSIVVPANGYQPSHGSADTTGAWASDAFLAVVGTETGSLGYFTYLGGTSGDAAFGLALAGAARVWLTGSSESLWFDTRDEQGRPTQRGGYPRTADAFQRNNASFEYVTSDVVLSLIDSTAATADASLIYSTYVGGADAEVGLGLAGASSASVAGQRTWIDTGEVDTIAFRLDPSAPPPPTATPTATPPGTPTGTPTVTPTLTATPSVTPTGTLPASATASATSTSTATVTASETATPTVTASATATAAATPTPSPAHTETPEPTSTASSAPSTPPLSSSPTPTALPSSGSDDTGESESSTTSSPPPPAPTAASAATPPPSTGGDTSSGGSAAPSEPEPRPAGEVAGLFLGPVAYPVAAQEDAATGAPGGGAAFPLMVGGHGEAIFSPALLALLPPGTRLELVYNPVPSLSNEVAAGSLGGGSVTPLPPPIGLRLRAVAGGVEVPLPPAILQRTFTLRLPVLQGAGFEFAWLHEVRYQGVFAGYVRVPGAFVPTLNALDYEVGVADLAEGRLFLPARITPAYVAVHDPTARFWSGPTPDAIDLGPATPELGRLLVVAPQVLNRIYVFSPTTNNYAWLDAPHLGPA